MMDKYDERLVRAVTFERDQWQKEVNALRSELVQWKELHRVIAEELTGGLGWPDHGNAALAIAATFMLHKQRLEKAEAERDALRQALVEQQRIDAQICRTAQDWSDGSLGWNRACERMALAIEKQTARAALEGKL